MELGPNFLQNDDPELITIGGGETRSCLAISFFARDEVIYENLKFFTRLGELTSIDTLFVRFIIDKEIPNSLRVLCKSR